MKGILRRQTREERGTVITTKLDGLQARISAIVLKKNTTFFERGRKKKRSKEEGKQKRGMEIR